MRIDELIKLTDDQQALAEEMQALYLRMQEASLAFAVNDNGEVVVYNSEHIDDCEMPNVFGEVPEGYESVDTDAMESLFPVWVAEDLCVRRK